MGPDMHLDIHEIFSDECTATNNPPGIITERLWLYKISRDLKKNNNMLLAIGSASIQ